MNEVPSNQIGGFVCCGQKYRVIRLVILNNVESTATDAYADSIRDGVRHTRTSVRQRNEQNLTAKKSERNFNHHESNFIASDVMQLLVLN